MRALLTGAEFSAVVAADAVVVGNVFSFVSSDLSESLPTATSSGEKSASYFIGVLYAEFKELARLRRARLNGVPFEFYYFNTLGNTCT